MRLGKKESVAVAEFPPITISAESDEDTLVRQVSTHSFNDQNIQCFDLGQFSRSPDSFKKY